MKIALSIAPILAGSVAGAVQLDQAASRPHRSLCHWRLKRSSTRKQRPEPRWRLGGPDAIDQASIKRKAQMNYCLLGSMDEPAVGARRALRNLDLAISPHGTALGLEATAGRPKALPYPWST